MPSKIVEVTAYDEPEQLLEALRGSNDKFWQELPHDWMFRGHADAAWQLLPSALRKGSLLTHHPERPGGPYDSMKNQLDAETEKIMLFAELANRQGLAVPGGWQASWKLLIPDQEKGFPATEHWELFALAQHHGVPTRFLDWSRKALVAAYFAAHGAAQMMNEKRLEEASLLGVWALKTGIWADPEMRESVRIVDPPRYGNRNLIAQDGVFTIHTYPWSANEAPRCEPLDETLARMPLRPALRFNPPRMRLLTLPARKARKLLIRLESENVSAATLFPGYDGVARAMNERLTHSDSAWRSPAREE